MAKKLRMSGIILSVISVVITIIFIFPYLYMVLSSLKTNQEVFKYAYPLSWSTFFPPNPTLENYFAVFAKQDFGRKILNSLLVASAQVLGTLVVCSLSAYAFARISFRGKGILFGLVMLTVMVPFEVMMIPTYIIIRRLNMQNTYWSLFLPWIASPFGVMLLRQTFLEIPKDLDDAASVEGASSFQILIHVILPNSISSLITLALMTFINSWNSFLWPLIVMQDSKKQLVQVAIAALAPAHEYPQWALIFAAASISTIPVLIIFLFLQKYYIKGAVMSGIKG